MCCDFKKRSKMVNLVVVSVLIVVILVGSVVTLKPTPSGLYPAVFTPFDQNGELNLTVIPEYAKHLRKNGVDGVLVAGTSGEGPSLSINERKKLLHEWLNFGKPLGLNVVMQVGGMPMSEVLEMAKYAETSGADAIMTLPELYFKPKTEEQAVDYVKLVSEAAPSLPILFYDHPSYSGVNLNMVKFFQLATEKVPNFKGAKCGFSAILRTIAAIDLNEDQILFTKSPLSIASSALLGFNSSMAGAISIFPKLITDIQRAIANKDVDSARELQTILSKRMSVILAQGDSVAAQKVTMEMVTGTKVGETRNPIVKLSPNQRKLIQQNLQDLGVKLVSK